MGSAFIYYSTYSFLMTVTNSLNGKKSLKISSNYRIYRKKAEYLPAFVVLYDIPLLLVSHRYLVGSSNCFSVFNWQAGTHNGGNFRYRSETCIGSFENGNRSCFNSYCTSGSTDFQHSGGAGFGGRMCQIMLFEMAQRNARQLAWLL